MRRSLELSPEVAQYISQICRTYGYTKPDGTADLERFARMAFASMEVLLEHSTLLADGRRTVDLVLSRPEEPESRWVTVILENARE